MRMGPLWVNPGKILNITTMGTTAPRMTAVTCRVYFLQRCGGFWGDLSVSHGGKRAIHQERCVCGQWVLGKEDNQEGDS